MELKKTITKTKAFIARSLKGFLEHRKNMNKWNNSTSLDATYAEFDGHVVVVKNPKYAEVAQICIASFLHFHPNARITVHCDSTTMQVMKKKSKFGLHGNQVKVINDLTFNETWQDLKLGLISNLQGTNEFLMDADLKWNGPIEKFAGITFFVREFMFHEDKLYLELFRDLGIVSQLDNSMKNTSFFSWQGKALSEGNVSELMELRKRICDSAGKLGVDSEQKNSIIRISEQLALSLLIQDSDASFLKAKDAQFDGRYVESSYFGATGTRFSKFGITSRRYG